MWLAAYTAGLCRAEGAQLLWLDCCLLHGLTQMKHRLSRAENCTQWLLAWHERKGCRKYELQSWPHTA